MCVRERERERERVRARVRVCGVCVCVRVLILLHVSSNYFIFTCVLRSCVTLVQLTTSAIIGMQFTCFTGTKVQILTKLSVSGALLLPLCHVLPYQPLPSSQVSLSLSRSLALSLSLSLSLSSTAPMSRASLPAPSQVSLSLSLARALARSLA